MLKLWPFTSKAEPKVPNLNQPMNWAVRLFEERVLIDNDDFSQNFRENQDVLTEFAPLDQSADPEFRREFFALAEKLKQIEHPAILKLYSFGEENGRLYRTWANRRLFFAGAFPAENSPERRRQLAQAVEGFQLLHQIGVALENHSPRFLSYDRGMFIARYPFVPHGEPGQSGYIPRFMYYTSPPDPELLKDRCFLIQLGVFMAVSLTGTVPFLEPPLHSKSKGEPVKRRELPLDSPLKEVVNRTQLEPDTNFPDLATGLEEVRKALLAGL